MNLKKVISFAVFFALTVSALLVSGSALNYQSIFGRSVKFDTTWINGSAKHPVHDGLVTSGTGTVTEKVTSPTGNLVTTKITPSTSYTGTMPLGLKHTSVSNMKFLLSDVRYIRYYYYYEGNYKGRASVVFPASDFNITKEQKIYSMETVKSGEWAYLTFDLNEMYGYDFQDGIIDKFYFYPFGDTKVSALSPGSIYLRELFLLGEQNALLLTAKQLGTFKQTYPVSFVSGRPDVKGTAPETIYVEEGKEVTLPQNTFVRDGYKFAGWICSVGSNIYQPGDTYTIESRTRKNGQITAAVEFIAHWVLVVDKEEQADFYPSVNRVPNAPYFQGLVDNRKYGTITENVMFDGFTTAKFVPDPTGADAKRNYINIDGYSWYTLPLDLAQYKCMIVPYYFKSHRETVYYTPKINMLGDSASPDRALSESIAFEDKNGVKTNQWALMVFEFDFKNDSDITPYLKWELNTIQSQIHFYPLGNTRASALSASEAIYFGDIIFLDYIPESRPEFSKGFINGDGTGSFRPSELLTKAEAASIAAKISGYVEDYVAEESGYSDINSAHWCFPYVSFLEKKGVLAPSKGELFMPDEKCPTDLYLTWTTKIAADGDTGTKNVGTLPKNPSANKLISRAEAVSLASGIAGGNMYNMSDALTYMKGVKLFDDVTENQWFYPAISLSSVSSVKTTENGASKIIDTFITSSEENKSIPQELYDAGTQYVKSLDATTERRIDEIRNTNSEYKQKSGGKTVYVSNTFGNGTVTNSSQSNPVRISSISEISKFTLNPGDVVLLRRDEIYRGSFQAKPGVTYSAYGDGDKPVIMPSRENGSGSSKWILDDTDSTTGAKIWKYHDETFTDVGGINLISSDGTHLVAYKEIPDYKNGKYFDRKTDIEYDYKKMLDHDLMYVHFANISPETKEVILNTPNDTAIGPLYLRCDKGNPGSLYPSIEFNSNEHAIKILGHGVTIDNLCIKYFGRHGVSAGTVHNLTVRNCEIGWGGGSIQSYNNTTKTATRFGNGVEIYGGLINFVIDNCYVYEIYDAGITHQISAISDGHYFMEGVYYTNNVLLNSTYNIEYFMSKNNAEYGLQERYMKNVFFTGNITRKAGYGWGVQRPDNAPSNVKGWTHHNLCDNQVYENNIFDRCIDLQNNTTDYPIMTGTTFESSTPYLKNNIFVQVPGRIVMLYHKMSYRTAADTEKVINRLGGTGNKLYFYPDDFKDYEYMVPWKPAVE